MMFKWIIKLFKSNKKVSPCIHGGERLKCKPCEDNNVFEDRVLFDDGIRNCYMTEDEYKEAIDYSAWSKYCTQPLKDPSKVYEIPHREEEEWDRIHEMKRILDEDYKYFKRMHYLYMDNNIGRHSKKLLAMKQHNIDSIVKMNELLVGMHMEFKEEHEERAMITFCDGTTFDRECPEKTISMSEQEFLIFRERDELDGTKTFHRNNCICAN